jgi:regulator of replication initiation timing
MANPTTSLEVIAEKLQEKRQTNLEQILMVSGSAAITKNEYNVTVVDNTNIASSLLFKPLNTTKYDETELLKAIDVKVKELAPNIPIPNLDLVPKPLYDSEVVTTTDLKKQVANLNTQIDTLNTQITDLKGQVQSEINKELSIEQTNDVLSNQLDTLGGTIQDFSTQIQTAVQKSVDESILRASLQAQNTGFKAQIEALIKQIDSLNSIIEGLQSQLGAVQQQQAIQQGTQAQALAGGADVINEVVIAKITQKQEPANPPIFGKINAKGGNKWVNGGSVSFTNNDKQPVTISIQTTPTAGISWFYPAESDFTIAAGAQKEINLTINEAAASNVDSKGGKSYSHSADYIGGSMKIVVKRNDGSSNEKSYDAKFSKLHPSSY